MKPSLHLLLFSVLTLVALADDLGAQGMPGGEAEMPAEGNTPEEADAASGEPDLSGWEIATPSGMIAETSVARQLTPGPFMVIRYRGKEESIQPSDLRLDSESSGHFVPEFREAVKNAKVRWPAPNSRVKHFAYGPIIAQLKRCLSGDLKDRRAFLRFTIKGKGLARARETHAIEVSKLEVLQFPQTWENIWQRQVASVPVESRLTRLKAFDTLFQQIIRNPEAREDWFSPEERQAYGRFYQQQFNYVRDRNPASPELYWQLAEFHQERDNVDALIGVYLDAIRNEVPEDDRVRFHRRLGEVMVKRLGLYREAVDHLSSSIAFVSSRLLLIEAHHRLGSFDAAMKLARETREILGSAEEAESPSLRFVEGEELDRESALRQAMLLEARALILQDKLADAYKAFSSLIEGGEAVSDEAAYLMASMLVYRGKDGDAQQAIQYLTTRERFRSAYMSVNPNRRNATEGDEDERIEYAPLVSRALVLWVAAENQSGRRVRESALARSFAVLDLATQLDPLSGETALERGRLLELGGLFPRAREAYQSGLLIAPDDHRLLYRYGSLLLRAGEYDSARSQLLSALRFQPGFYPCLNALGEIALAEAAALAEEIRVEQAADAKSERLAGLSDARVQKLRLAASFFSSSLRIGSDQRQLQISLASLNCELATHFNEEAIRISYLRRARSMADDAIRHLEDLRKARSASSKLTDHEVNDAPHPAGLAIYAWASWELFVLKGQESDQDKALKALRRLQEIGPESISFASNEAYRAFRESPVWSWSRSALARMESLNRRRRKIDDFGGRSVASGSSPTLEMGRGWQVLGRHKPDSGFRRAVSCENGMLNVGVEKQQESGTMSRLSRQESFGKLALFKAEIASIGEATFSRGVHLTRVGEDDEGLIDKRIWTMMLGLDSDNRVFWDIRVTSADGTTSRSALIEGRTFIAADEYGGAVFEPGASLQLGLERAVDSEKGAEVHYFALVNGYRIQLPIDSGYVQKDQLKFLTAASDISDSADEGMRIGFFAYGARGRSGIMQVDSAEWVVDADLAGTGRGDRR